MFKKLLTGVSAVIIGCAVVSEAKAECDGIYLGLRGGISNPRIADKSVSATGSQLKIDDNVLMLSGALGYRYGYFRAEVEYIWRDADDDKATISFPGPGGVPITSTDRAEFDYQSYMFNVYWDLSPYTWFTPYFSAGLGWTDLEYKFTYEGQGTDKYSKDNFTWSLGAGISAKMTNRLNLDIGYRFFDMGKMGRGKIRNHEFYGGARYVF